ncbi:M24 family metallopeptidase [Falsiroseomonas sp. HW251]|uniref:M24 family metallopeptidase n=1 Tax=Falsiroseomonas sp. HW251 TaxID=3390998 RepID=UPI003D3178A6
MPSAATDPALEATLRALPAKLGLDAIVAISPENFTGVSGARIDTMVLIRHRQAFAMLPARGEPELMVCAIEKTWTASQSWIETINTYREFLDDPMDKLAERLAARGLTNARIGIDADFLPLASCQRLMAHLPNITLVDTHKELTAIRAIKTPSQVAALEAAAKGTHRATIEAMRATKLGDTEKEMVGRIGDGIARSGAERPFFLYLLSGDRTAISHGLPSDRRLQESEIIRFDVGGIYGPYCSDFARTYSSGKPTDLQRRTYAALREIEELAIEAVKPGVAAHEIHALCAREYARRGLTFRMGLVGHSLGVELHEAPVMRPGEKTEFAPGMVLNVECSVMDESNTYFHLEDLVVVTDTGTRLLTLGLAPTEIPTIG